MKFKKFKIIEIGNNGKILKDIESSLFILCLDKKLTNDAFKSKNNESVRSVQCMTGFNSDTNAGNRWHDKTVQVNIFYTSQTFLNFIIK